jgi:hypothetical protein
VTFAVVGNGGFDLVGANELAVLQASRAGVVALDLVVAHYATTLRVSEDPTAFVGLTRTPGEKKTSQRKWWRGARGGYACRKRKRCRRKLRDSPPHPPPVRGSQVNDTLTGKRIQLGTCVRSASWEVTGFLLNQQTTTRTASRPEAPMNTCRFEGRGRSALAQVTKLQGLPSRATDTPVRIDESPTPGKAVSATLKTTS